MKTIRTYEEFTRHLRESLVEDGEDRYVFSSDGVKVVMEVVHDPYEYDFRGVVSQEKYDRFMPMGPAVKIEHVESANPGKGFGTTAMHGAIEAMRDMGHETFYLNASPMIARGAISKISDLIRFYEKFGFRVVQHQGGNAMMALSELTVGTPAYVDPPDAKYHTYERDPESWMRESFTHRFQEKSYTCGPTAVKMVLDWLGYADVPVDYLERVSKTDDIVGCTDKSMSLMLDTLGVKYKRHVGEHATSWDALRSALRDGRKVVVRTLTRGIKHWIVVHGESNGVFEVADPWLGSIRYDSAQLEQIWQPREWDCFVIESDPFPKLHAMDGNYSACVSLARKCFPGTEEWIESYLEETTDKSISVCLKIGGEVVGAYFLCARDLVSQEGKGLEGVCLCMDERYRGNGWGKMLISFAESMPGFDYMWGQHLKTLNNLEQWTKRRETVIDAGEVWITIKRLK